jgi:hypothetical protein
VYVDICKCKVYGILFVYVCVCVLCIFILIHVCLHLLTSLSSVYWHLDYCRLSRASGCESAHDHDSDRTDEGRKCAKMHTSDPTAAQE